MSLWKSSWTDFCTKSHFPSANVRIEGEDGCYATALMPCVILCNELYLKQDALCRPSFLSMCENSGARWHCLVFPRNTCPLVQRCCFFSFSFHVLACTVQLRFSVLRSLWLVVSMPALLQLAGGSLASWASGWLPVLRAELLISPSYTSWKYYFLLKRGEI